MENRNRNDEALLPDRDKLVKELNKLTKKMHKLSNKVDEYEFDYNRISQNGGKEKNESSKELEDKADIILKQYDEKIKNQNNNNNNTVNNEVFSKRKKEFEKKKDALSVAQTNVINKISPYRVNLQTYQIKIANLKNYIDVLDEYKTFLTRGKKIAEGEKVTDEDQARNHENQIQTYKAKLKEFHDKNLVSTQKGKTEKQIISAIEHPLDVMKYKYQYSAIRSQKKKAIKDALVNYENAIKQFAIDVLAEQKFWDKHQNIEIKDSKKTDEVKESLSENKTKEISHQNLFEEQRKREIPQAIRFQKVSKESPETYELSDERKDQPKKGLFRNASVEIPKKKLIHSQSAENVNKEIEKKDKETKDKHVETTKKEIEKTLEKYTKRM